MTPVSRARKRASIRRIVVASNRSLLKPAPPSKLESALVRRFRLEARDDPALVVTLTPTAPANDGWVMVAA